MVPTSILTLLKALCLVPPNLISNCKYALDRGDDLRYGNERNFAYELYRQWENLIEYNNEDMVINAEVPKKYSEEKYLEYLCKIFGYSKKGKIRSCFYPDLVYHHSQYDSHIQELICEIKTLNGLKDKSSPKLITDLKKLSAYMRKETLLTHPFNKGAFILLGGTMKDIKKRYRGEPLVEEKAKDIYCITYNLRRLDNKCYIPCISIELLSSLLSL
ncbi:MAG: hypothetical protein J5552_09920 [Prevotella sp.]|nr:hypothetical protein [Prevotella sp.]